MHKSLNARMVEYAGFEMPVEYTGITDEHLAVRNAVGVFDVSHMGEIWVKGPGAIDLLQKITTNDVSKLSSGNAQYSCFPNGKGGIVDDLIIYQYEQNKYLLVVNASNVQKDYDWIVRNNHENVEIENSSDRISQLAVQGPMAGKTLQKVTNTDLSSLHSFTFTTGSVGGVPDVIIAATGYTGSGGYELYFDNRYAGKIWNALFDAGKAFRIKPIGLAARDTLRLEAGYCLYGNDIDDTTSPIEAGLGWITKFTERKDFIDKDFLLDQKKNGVKKVLRGFEMIDRGIPRQHYDIVDYRGTKIGEVTSGTMSPVLKKGIGMGYVPQEFSEYGSELFVTIRNKPLKAAIVKMPFYKP